MNKIVSLALLIVGLVLLIFGLQAGDSVGSEVSEALQGAPSNKAIWLTVAGVLGIVIGGVGLIRRTAR